MLRQKGIILHHKTDAFICSVEE